jgi:DNA polymerase elongation subunit (family B)
MNIYLDIETIPTQSDEVRAEIAATITPPGNISKADTIAAWNAEKKPALVKEAIAKTSFDGATGHICCIGWAVGWAKPKSASVHRIDDEKLTLQAVFAELAAEVKDEWQSPTIIGHNVINFDIRFVWQRAIILGVKLPQWFPRDPKPWGSDAFDTMTAFAGSRGTIGMDRLCRALGMGGKGEIDGSMVGDLWAAGEHDKIAAYCRADIERTREIHRRMMVAFGEEAA